MRAIAVALSAVALGSLAAAGCGSSPGSSAQPAAAGAAQGCWETGPGLEIFTVSTTVSGCTAIMYDGDTNSADLPTATQVASLGQPLCAYQFPTISWRVWGDSANAESLCGTLANTPGGTSS
jgi:hypothetical protein